MEIRLGFKMLTIQSIQIMNFSVLIKVFKPTWKEKKSQKITWKDDFPPKCFILTHLGLDDKPNFIFNHPISADFSSVEACVWSFLKLSKTILIHWFQHLMIIFICRSSWSFKMKIVMAIFDILQDKRLICKSRKYPADCLRTKKSIIVALKT